MGKNRGTPSAHISPLLSCQIIFCAGYLEESPSVIFIA